MNDRRFVVGVIIAVAIGSVPSLPIRGDDPPGGKVLVPHDQRVISAAVTPDGKSLVYSSGTELTLRIRDFADGKTRTWDKPAVDVAAFAIAPNGKWVALNRKSGSIRIASLADGTERKEFQVERPSWGSLDFSPDSTLLAHADSDHTFVIRKVSDGSITVRVRSASAVPAGKSTFVSSARFTADGKSLIVLSSSFETKGLVTVWSVADGKFLQSAVPTRNAGMMALSPDGKRLAIGDQINSVVTVLDPTNDFAEVAALRIPGGCGSGLCFSPDGKQLVTVSTAWERKNPMATIWSAADGKRMRQWSLPPANVHWNGEIVTFTPDGKKLIIGGGNEQMRTWLMAE